MSACLRCLSMAAVCRDRQVHVVGSGQQPTLMRTHVPILRAAPTKPVSPTLATARRSHHSHSRQPASVSVDAGAPSSRPRSAGAALRASAQAAPSSGPGRAPQQNSAAAFNAGAPRVARQFAARRGGPSAVRASRSTSAKQPPSARSAPRSVTAVAPATKDGTAVGPTAADTGATLVRGAPGVLPCCALPPKSPRADANGTLFLVWPTVDVTARTSQSSMYVTSLTDSALGLCVTAQTRYRSGERLRSHLCLCVLWCVCCGMMCTRCMSVPVLSDV